MCLRPLLFLLVVLSAFAQGNKEAKKAVVEEVRPAPTPTQQLPVTVTMPQPFLMKSEGTDRSPWMDWGPFGLLAVSILVNLWTINVVQSNSLKQLEANNAHALKVQQIGQDHDRRSKQRNEKRKTYSLLCKSLGEIKDSYKGDRIYEEQLDRFRQSHPDHPLVLSDYRKHVQSRHDSERSFRQTRYFAPMDISQDAIGLVDSLERVIMSVDSNQPPGKYADDIVLELEQGILQLQRIAKLDLSGGAQHPAT